MKIICFAMISALALLTGCRAKNRDADTEPKLKRLLSATDNLRLIDRYAESVYKDGEAKLGEDPTYHFAENTWPAIFSVTPIVVTDQQSGTKTKGALVVTTGSSFQVAEKMNQGESRSFVLDEDELKDFVKAIDTESSTANTWASVSADHYHRLLFTTKDGLHVSLEQAPKGQPKLFFGSEGESAPVVEVDLKNVSQPRGIVQSAIDLLGAH